MQENKLPAVHPRNGLRNPLTAHVEGHLCPVLRLGALRLRCFQFEDQADRRVLGCGTGRAWYGGVRLGMPPRHAQADAGLEQRRPVDARGGLGRGRRAEGVDGVGGQAAASGSALRSAHCSQGSGNN
eukprot:CAMPEP_0179344926 /NCGR_PEP_ID=MMETSP0797-20121207/71769_1 /TAXON_ID=47934 /ORGANISM="Dinophysis acuminata, Strain DAEP01" /LENGTH=126 /DNA_ID=CAMNT_0021059377 /DNA_START=624 /DNA_END=1001 /DNA_ORIENTATION=+